MNEKERELLDVIRNCPDPVQAVLTAIEVFNTFLTQCEEDQSHEPVCLPVFAGITEA